MVRKIFLMAFIMTAFILPRAVFPQEEGATGMITYIMGRVDITHSDKKTEKAVLKSKLVKGDTLKSYNNALCTIKLGTDANIYMKGSSVLSISELLVKDDGNNSRLKMLFGTLKIKLNKLQKNNELYVETPTAVVGVRGTYFETEANEEMTKVKVFKGAVSVKSRSENNTAAIEVKSGYSVTVTKNEEPTQPEQFQQNTETGNTGDTTAPVITIMKPSLPFEIVHRSSYNLLFMVIDDSLASVYINGMEVPDIKSGKLANFQLDLIPGANNISIMAIDNSGNSSLNTEKSLEYRELPPSPPTH